MGFRNSLIRLNNQIGYSFFNKSSAEGTFVGRDNQLFEEEYLFEFNGDYFIGDETWGNKVKKLKFIQDTLAKLNKTFVVILEPDKVSFYPDKLPSKYNQTSKKPNNYESFTKQLREGKVNFLDLNAYFLKIKETSEFPLFPQCGTHWSYYGSALAADTTIKFLEKITGNDLVNVKIIDNKIPEEPRHPDYDIGLAMNLIFPIPHQRTPDPVLKFESDKKNEKPSAIFIGDSFYFNWLNLGIPANVFKSCDFWYYNKAVTRSNGTKSGLVASRNLEEEIMRNDLIIIMVTSRMLHNFAWKFDEQLYSLLKPGYNDPFEYFASNIRLYDAHFIKLVSDAKEKGITLEERIKDEAKYMVYLDKKEHPEKYISKEDLIVQTENTIRSSPEWFAGIVAKARKNKLPVEIQIRKDAEWIYETKYKKEKSAL